LKGTSPSSWRLKKSRFPIYSVDICLASQLEKTISSIDPQYVVHAAAYGC